MNDTTANVGKTQQDKQEISIEFDVATAHSLLTTMDEATGTSDAAKADKENASLEYVQFAQAVLLVNAEDTDERSAIPRDTIVQGFCAEMDAMRPMLAAEGSRFVDVTEEDGKDTRYSWKGHGNNVKSIAKGVCEYYGLTHNIPTLEVDEDGELLTDEDGAVLMVATPALIDPADAESFTEVKKSVEQARRYGEKEEARLIREAKETLRESCKELIATAIKSDDYELITELADDVAHLRADWIADAKAQAELDAEASKVVIPIKDDETALQESDDAEQDEDDDEDDDEDAEPQAATA